MLVDGVLRRVDPQKRGIAQFVQEEICAPLGVEHYKLNIPEAEQSNYNLQEIGPSPGFYPMWVLHQPLRVVCCVCAHVCTGARVRPHACTRNCGVPRACAPRNTRAPHSGAHSLHPLFGSR